MDVPLTPIVVDVVTFDRAPLGRRGYHEDQVDDLLDRVQATLAGEDTLTAHDVREVEFDPAPFIRRGYHEDQVDEFLDLVVEELARREGGSGSTPNPGSTPDPGDVPAPGSGGGPSDGPVAWVPLPANQPWPVPAPTPAEQTSPMLFSQPPSLPSPSTQPLRREATAGPPNSSLAASTDKTGARADAEPGESPIRPASVEAGQAASAFRVGATSELVDSGPAGAVDEHAFPFPPAAPGEPGYAPSDVARLMKLLTAAPDRERLASLTFAVTTDGGYHTGSVDALRQAWLDALPTKRP